MYLRNALPAPSRTGASSKCNLSTCQTTFDVDNKNDSFAESKPRRRDILSARYSMCWAFYQFVISLIRHLIHGSFQWLVFSAGHFVKWLFQKWVIRQSFHYSARHLINQPFYESAILSISHSISQLVISSSSHFIN